VEMEERTVVQIVQECKCNMVKEVVAMSPKERLEFYKNNPKTKEELLNWFKVSGYGLRCMALRPEDKKIPYVYRNIFSEYKYALTPLIDDLFNNSVKFARTVEFLPWLFDTCVLKCMRRADVGDYEIGITYVIDIDAPDINEKVKSMGRYDLLYETGEYLDTMNHVIDIFKDELSKVDLWKRNRLTFTGNGINIVFPPYYDSMVELYKYIDGIIGLIQDVIEITGYNFMHYKRPGWSSNFKPPGTFHFSNNRLTLEINDINKKLNLEWLTENSNPFNDRIYKQKEI
jgi:hypothetical protein